MIKLFSLIFLSQDCLFWLDCFQVLEDLEAMVAFGGKNGAKNGIGLVKFV